MTITAQFAGYCRKCGRSIAAGEKIEWEKGTGASHIKCASKAEPLYNSPPPVESAGNVDPTEAAAKFGRTAVAGATVTTFSVHGLGKGDNGKDNGSIRIVRGKRYVQIARSTRRYFSRDDLEDFDMFDAKPGGAYDWQGVEVEPTTAEAAADAAKAEQVAVEKAAKQAAHDAEKAAQDAAKKDASVLLDGLTQCSVGPQDDERSQITWDASAAVRIGSSLYTPGVLPSGDRVVREDFSAYDDWRTYHYGTAATASRWCLAAGLAAGITPEAAREWLAKYTGCHGEDLYRAIAEADTTT